MSATSRWVCVLAACVLGFVTKYVGYLVPESLVDGRRRSRIIGLLPVALLAGLLVTHDVRHAACAERTLTLLDGAVVSTTGGAA